MYIPASDPVLFLKLSADYNYAYMAHGRTGGVVLRAYDRFQKAHALGIPAVPWGFSCPEKTVRHIRQEILCARKLGGELEILMIYREPDLPVIPAPESHGFERRDDVPQLMPSKLRDSWLDAGFSAERHGSLEDRTLALAQVEEFTDTEPLDLARYEHTSTHRPLSLSMRGSLSRALGSRYKPAEDPGALSKIYWVQGRAVVYDILDFERFSFSHRL